MKSVSLISIAINIFFICILIPLFLFPIIAIKSVYEVYNASYNYKKVDEINSKELCKGDTFWGEVEISTTNKDTLGLVAYTSFYTFKPAHIWVKKDIKTYIPNSILINTKYNKNASLIVDKNIIDFEFLNAYNAPFLEPTGFFSVHKNWLPTIRLSEAETNGNGYKAKGIMKGKSLFAKYKVESVDPFVLSTNNPCGHSEPEKLWKGYTNGFFWPYAHILAGFFLLIDTVLIYSIIKKKLKERSKNESY